MIKYMYAVHAGVCFYAIIATFSSELPYLEPGTQSILAQNTKQLIKCDTLIY